jgi:2-isopropylmalate synthase
MIKSNAQTGAATARSFTATGADTDIVVSSTRAYVACLNRMIAYHASSVSAAEEAAAAAAEEAAAAAEAEAPAAAA